MARERITRISSSQNLLFHTDASTEKRSGKAFGCESSLNSTNKGGV